MEEIFGNVSPNTGKFGASVQQGWHLAGPEF